jgi:hypothetical protein
MILGNEEFVKWLTDNGFTLLRRSGEVPALKAPGPRGSIITFQQARDLAEGRMRPAQFGIDNLRVPPPGGERIHTNRQPSLPASVGARGAMDPVNPPPTNSITPAAAVDQGLTGQSDPWVMFTRWALEKQGHPVTTQNITQYLPQLQQDTMTDPKVREMAQAFVDESGLSLNFENVARPRGGTQVPSLTPPADKIETEIEKTETKADDTKPIKESEKKEEEKPAPGPQTGTMTLARIIAINPNSSKAIGLTEADPPQEFTLSGGGGYRFTRIGDTTNYSFKKEPGVGNERIQAAVTETDNTGGDTGGDDTAAGDVITAVDTGSTARLERQAMNARHGEERDKLKTAQRGETLKRRAEAKPESERRQRRLARHVAKLGGTTTGADEETKDDEKEE